MEAVRIAVKYRTPVIILSDGYLANGSEPWRIPEVAGLPRLRDEFSFASPNDWPGDGDDARVPAVPAGSEDAGPAVGDSRHAGPRAPDRRHREGRRRRHDLLRPR